MSNQHRKKHPTGEKKGGEMAGHRQKGIKSVDEKFPDEQPDKPDPEDPNEAIKDDEENRAV